jgi:hypothetical protein
MIAAYADRPPCTDLAPVIQTAITAFGPCRCMRESDSPFQVQGERTFRTNLDFVRQRLAFLAAADKEWLLQRTAEAFLFSKLEAYRSVTMTAMKSMARQPGLSS